MVMVEVELVGYLEDNHRYHMQAHACMIVFEQLKIVCDYRSLVTHTHIHTHLLTFLQP